MSESKTDPTNDDPIEAARDRLTDRVLAEAISGEAPPDLAETIASRADDERVAPLPSETKTMASKRAWIVLLTTAASLMLAVMVWREVGHQKQITQIARTSAEERQQVEDRNQVLEEQVDELEQSFDVADKRVREVMNRNKQLAKDSGTSEALETLDTPRVAINALSVDVGKLIDTRELRDSERRLGASTVFNTNPTQGSTPAISYSPSPETAAWLKQRGLMAEGSSSERRSMRSPDDAPAAGAPVATRPRGAPSSPRRDAGYFFSTDKLSARSQPTAEDLRWFKPVDLASDYGDLCDQYAAIQENSFTKPLGEDALSTFSIDVDTASYSNVRQYLTGQRQLPPADAVRVEELVNYFEYGYAAPDADSEDPFAASMEVAACPWKPKHRLVRIGIKGREVQVDQRPLSNLVFLIDVSGSMNTPNKLPLVVAGLEALTDRLGENDRVAIVVYAGSQGVVLPSTSGEQKDEIRSALGRLQAGGSTAGGAGLKLAYEIAERNRIPGGVNRVVLCTDGDFNVGLTGTEELSKLVETRAKETGVFLTVLGFGRGNLNDAMLESISGRGDGHYAYIDNEKEARRVLSRNLSGTLVTIAKDVKLQVEFNPAKVASYRLVGYENRVMAAKDFNDDTKDAGEIGAGHTVTALYEVVPIGVEEPVPSVDGLKYQSTAVENDAARVELTLDAETPGEGLPISTELLTLKIRYKQPEGGASKKLEFPLDDDISTVDPETTEPASEDFRWAAAVAEFGLRLRGSEYAGDGSFSTVLERARGALGEDAAGYRAEFLDLVRRASELSNQ